ncbi:MAG: hypothetical protein HGA19_24620, partial [Oscillochloris sp.]|nr:hypothetical protein [Oscillochloris sp.]
MAARLLLVVLLTALAGCAAAPTPTALPTAPPTAPPALTPTSIPPLAWHETPVMLGDMEGEDLCFLPDRPNTVVANISSIGAVAYNLVTGEQQVISRHKVIPNRDESCEVNSAGDTFFGWSKSEDYQAWRFSLADSEGRPLAHWPAFVAHDDWNSIYGLEHEIRDHYAFSTLWLSSDQGDTWEQLTLPDDMVIQAVVMAPYDSARLFAIGLGTSDGSVQATLYRSTDSGHTWEPRAQL